MRVIFSGSRGAPACLKRAIRKRIEELPEGVVIVHGAHWSGVDRMVDQVAQELGFSIERHPADWDAYGTAAGPMRNREMAESGADLAITFWDGESKGTMNFRKHAKSLRIELEEYDLAGNCVDWTSKGK